MSQEQKTQENPHVKQMTAEEALRLLSLVQAKRIATQQAELAQKDFSAASAEYTNLLGQLAGKYFEGAEKVALSQDGRSIINVGELEKAQASAVESSEEVETEEATQEVK